MSAVDDKLRYARHLLLAEIGEAGQRRLCAAGFRIGASADPRVAAVAGDYLTRSGMQTLPSGASDALALPGSEQVACLAGDVALQEAAAALLGAYAAVEAIKACVGAGRAGQLSAALRLTGEPAS